MRDPSTHTRVDDHGASECSVDECTRAVNAYGRCQMHHRRWKKHSSTDLQEKPTPEQRFWSKVKKDAPGDCWEWTAQRVKSYGSFTVDGKSVYAHRFSYQLSKGDIPAGNFVDHMCHNTLCVNPAHLQAVTPSLSVQNRKGATRNSISGYRGVSLVKKTGRWRARAYLHGKYYGLGTYGSAEEASKVASSWRRKHMPNSLVDREETA